MSQQHHIPRKPSTNQINQIPELGNDYGLPPVPATLVAGMDPAVAQEISDRIYDERRASFSNQNVGQQPRGSYQDSPHYQQNMPHQTQHYQDDAMVPYAPPSASSYDERSRGYGNASVPRQKLRGVSPNPQTPARKSVSPSPGHSEDRCLSGVPFGPDSYNSLNPSVSASKSTPSLSARYDTSEPDPDAKIITHDGREIDPSDHIPESNYAPLLESKGPKYASQQPDRNYRTPPQSNSQPGSGRRQLKVAARPQSMTGSPSPAVYMGTGPNDPLAAQSGRNRLQKKANRMSAMPAPHPSPLAPTTPYQNNSHTPRSATRQNTSDYNASENYSPNYGAGYRGSAGPPPIPAKVPVGMSSTPPQSGGGDAWALLEEMKNIDLGSGRARRRGY
ncbi:hypothetical protein BJ875DRAFT_365229 [Amylocarpus encephaloides]|uniref:Uncharacterized protein n=1 Tax=Amylocarpus encephaloides TaxID=45428 RepID=A0A9P7YV49_9HELO|nr:hypothetical protein BJ875DRAFT_365229 [Amylocarpus encephaloides]